MGVVTIKHRGNFKNFEKFATNYDRQKLLRILEGYGREGVNALRSATPVDSGLTRDSWGYRASVSPRSFFLIFENSNLTSQGTPVAILIQYGHATKDGGFITGTDFINPAVRPVFDRIANAIWKEVINP